MHKFEDTDPILWETKKHDRMLTVPNLECLQYKMIWKWVCNAFKKILWTWSNKFLFPALSEPLGYLSLQPTKMSKSHKITRLIFLLDCVAALNDSLEKALPLSYRVWLHLSDYVNSKTSRHWNIENPNCLHSKPTFIRSKDRVWSALSPNRILGQYVFETTPNSVLYQERLHRLVAQLQIN